MMDTQKMLDFLDSLDSTKDQEIIENIKSIIRDNEKTKKNKKKYKEMRELLETASAFLNEMTTTKYVIDPSVIKVWYHDEYINMFSLSFYIKNWLEVHKEKKEKRQ